MMRMHASCVRSFMHAPRVHTMCASTHGRACVRAWREYCLHLSRISCAHSVRAQGLGLHALRQYGAAVRVLDRASSMEPSNTQIKDAVRMAEMMARKHGAGEAYAPPP